MFGRLTIDAFKHDLIQNGAVFSQVFGFILVVALLTYYKKWGWIWKGFLTSLDPKKIGIMYLVVILLMMIKGLGDAAMMRVQQFMGVDGAHGFISADHFQQVFSAHGSTMIFFVAMGFIFAMMNLVIPLQIGARDVAFPFLNAVSFWLFAAGGMLMLISLGVGDFSISGWLAYPPLSGLEYSPNEGVDYWIWIVQIAGVGSTLGGINFFVTIFKMRCPGMTLMRMPIFCWAVLCCVILIIFAFPILTATLGLLTLDRYLGMHFFTASFGGNPMLYINLIWAWGHPEVYILVLPAFGVYSEIVTTFCHKSLFGYTAMVWALVIITFLSFIVWLHHFFTMGAGPDVNAFFGVMTILIAVPTGVKIFNWLFTMFRGKIVFTVPMLWFLGFIIHFTIGGMTGVLLSVPPIDFEVHNSLFLIAHFHGVIIAGVLFAFFGGFTYWFPKIFGYQLNERIGKYAFWCWFFGFTLAFMPLYILGYMGATRRLDHYPSSTGWHPFFAVALVGLLIIMLGLSLQIWQIVYSFIHRKQLRDATGDPWNGRNLEWATVSPPPEYNFAFVPVVETREAFWTKKIGHNLGAGGLPYEDIHMPNNSPIPLFIGGFATLFGFAIIWHMVFFSIVGFVGAVVCVIIRLCCDNGEHVIPADEVKRIEAESRRVHV